ncbi:unnamed protein product [Rotaria magnacalcarata]|uniref:Uncharacterized protein n=2 Tax=Rotaria magnacalcarata TaxID=392030 RepID=A0A816VIX7_9BILA|nr:unnamed protein product [Rotaria magnacalcarata]
MDVEKILHLFIPYNNLCSESPNSDVCEYFQSTDPDVVEIGALIPYGTQTPAAYNKEQISNIIQQDFRRIILQHKVDRFIGKTKFIVYFIDDNFYITRNTTAQPKMQILPEFTNINSQTLIHRVTNPATLALEQLFNNKVGYDLLTDEQIIEILPLTISTLSEALTIENIKENIYMLTSLVVGQALYAMKSCSIRLNEHKKSGPACLVVSTVYRRLPKESSSFYQVYRLIPLPVLFQGEEYAYSNLPAVFGYNNLEKKVILWNNDDLSVGCAFSRIVHYRNFPISLSLSAVPCLEELLSVESPSIRKCQEPMILKLPCGRPIRCSNVQLPSTSCSDTTVTLITKYSDSNNKQFSSALRLSRITDRLVSAYEIAAGNTFHELQTEIDTNQTWNKKIIQQFGSTLISVLSLILINVLLLIIKIIKNKIKKQVQYLQTEINKIQRDFIDEL